MKPTFFTIAFRKSVLSVGLFSVGLPCGVRAAPSDGGHGGNLPAPATEKAPADKAGRTGVDQYFRDDIGVFAERGVTDSVKVDADGSCSARCDGVLRFLASADAADCMKKIPQLNPSRPSSCSFADYQKGRLTVAKEIGQGLPSATPDAASKACMEKQADVLKSMQNKSDYPAYQVYLDSVVTAGGGKPRFPMMVNVLKVDAPASRGLVANVPILHPHVDFLEPGAFQIVATLDPTSGSDPCQVLSAKEIERSLAQVLKIAEHIAFEGEAIPSPQDLLSRSEPYGSSSRLFGEIGRALNDPSPNGGVRGPDGKPLGDATAVAREFQRVAMGAIVRDNEAKK